MPPCPHFDLKIVQRSKRQSAVAAAAYQSGERLFSEYDQKQKYYSHKSEIVHTEIMLPPHAPPEYADRNTLWNAAEAIEKQWNSQLARRFVLAIPRELPRSQYADLIRDYCREFFVSKGMIADFAIHDKGDGNPHAHILLTMRAMDEQGKWLPKSRKVYVLSGIFLLPVTMQSHQIKISRNRKQIQQCAVENGTLFSCISFRTRYDESVTKKKERTPSRQRHCSLLRSLLRSNRSRSSMLMIRRFSIFCKLNEIKFSDRKWFEDAAGMPLPPDQPCPYCLSKGTLRLFGHYNRYLVEWDGNTQKCSTVTVQRHICDSCGHTHAILPSCIVPYRSYSLRFLLLVLRAYFTRPGSVEGLCDHYGITISMLYRWLRLFQQQKALWLGMLEDLFVPAVPFIDAMDVTLLKEFFLAFRFSYLESPRVTDPEMPPRKQQHPGSIT